MTTWLFTELGLRGTLQTSIAAIVLAFTPEKDYSLCTMNIVTDRLSQGLRAKIADLRNQLEACHYGLKFRYATKPSKPHI